MKEGKETHWKKVKDPMGDLYNYISKMGPLSTNAKIEELQKLRDEEEKLIGSMCLLEKKIAYLEAFAEVRGHVVLNDKFAKSLLNSLRMNGDTTYDAFFEKYTPVYCKKVTKYIGLFEKEGLIKIEDNPRKMARFIILTEKGKAYDIGGEND